MSVFITGGGSTRLLDSILLKIKKITLDRYIILLIILSIVCIASVVRYGLRTYQIPTWDEQHYMRMATEFYRLLKHASWNTPHDMLQVVPFRQPGYPLLIVPFYFVFGLSQAYFWAQFTNGLLYIATIFGIYFLAKLYLSRLASFLGAFIFAFYGWTLLHLHVTYSETATSAFTVWTIFWLMKSDYFQNRKYSLFFGISLGLALLVKWITIVFVFGPLLFIGYQMVKKRLFANRKVLLHVVLSFFIAFIISFYPYLDNNYWIFHYFYGHRKGGPMWQIVPEHERNPLSSYSLTFYLNSFAQLGVFYFILILVGVVLAFRKKSTVKPILLVVIVSYFFSAFALLKAERHIVPIYPYLAILSTSVFDYIKNKRYKLVLIVATVIISIFSFLGSTWGKGPMKQSLYALPIELPFGQLEKIYLTTISRPPYIYKISGREILDVIGEDSKRNRVENPQIVSLFYYRPLDEPLMVYNLYFQEEPFQITNYLGTVIQDPEKESYPLLEYVFKRADYILLKNGKRTDDYFPENNYQILKAFITLFDNHVSLSEYYEEKARLWIYQDSSQVTILKKKKEVPLKKMEKLSEAFVKTLKK